MTSNNLWMKSGNAQNHSWFLYGLKSYWWMAVICLVMYGFAGPMATMLMIDAIRKPSARNWDASGTEEALHEIQAQQVVTWVNGEGVLFFALAAVVLAAIVGCVMFFYLQQKRQIVFYHSQPITRTRLFWNQYGIGLLVNIIPLVFMILLNVLLIAMCGFGDTLSVKAIVLQGLYIFLFLWASYSIAVFSAQLTGMILTQIALNAVLHFGIPALVLAVSMLPRTFFSTYNAVGNWVDSSLKFSPFCAAIQALSNASALYTVPSNQMTVRSLPLSVGLVQLGIAILLTIAASWLYRKRQSEATGKSLLYPATEPIVKAYLMFVVSITAGMVFLEISNTMLFFYVAVILFAILTHMTCEVILQHDFKAMGRRFPQCAILLLLIGAVIGVFRLDLIGYDSYLPKPEQVDRVWVETLDGEAYSGYGDAAVVGSADPTVKELVYELLTPIVKEKKYQSVQAGRARVYDMDSETNSVSIEVRYQKNNGKETTRYYKNVPADAVEEMYAKLYNQREYRETLYQDLLNTTANEVDSLQVGDEVIYSDSIHSKKEVTMLESVLQAYQEDLRQRTFSDIQQPVLTTLYISWKESATMRWNSRYFPVYDTDEHVIKVLKEQGKFSLEQEQLSYTYVEALVFRGTAEDFEAVQNQMDTQETISAEEYIKALQGRVECTGRIEGQQEVTSFIQQTKLRRAAGAFVQRDKNHFVLLRYQQDTVQYWEWEKLYAGMLPIQYQ